MRTDDLWAEFNAARAALESPDRVMLEGYGIAPGDIVLLIGITRARVSAGLWEPAEDGAAGFVSLVLVEDEICPEASYPAQAVRFGELVDLLLWHPRRPDVWALRRGAAEWAGAIEYQFMESEPVPIRRSVLSWFQHRCTGLVPLATERPALYRLLTGCRNSIVAEDEAHAAELREVLEHPWPLPPVLIADGGLAHAA